MNDDTASSERRSDVYHAVRPRKPLSLVSRATVAAALVSLLMLTVQGGLYLQLQRAQRWHHATETAVAVARAVAGGGLMPDELALTEGIRVTMTDELPGEELRSSDDVLVDQDGDAAIAWAPAVGEGWVRATVRLSAAPRSPLLMAHVLLSLCILLIVLLLSRRFGRRYLSARIEHLARYTDALAAGTNGGRRPLDDIDDELGRFGARLNRLAERLDMAQKQVELERRSRDQAQQDLRVADRLASVGKVASTIAHDLGTPLNVISGQAELLEMRADPDSPAAKAARRIHEQALRMRDIIQNVLHFVRQRPRGYGTTASPIGPVLDNVIELLAVEASDAGVRLRIDECATAHGLFEPSGLLQALTNLVQNAVQASAAGGEVRIDCQVLVLGDDEIPSGFSPGERSLVISISDDGAGMSPEQQAEIFKPFYTTKAEGYGTGLGLAITTEIISSFDGALTVASTPDEGSTFRVWLRPDPQDDVHAATNDTRRPPEKGRRA